MKNFTVASVHFFAESNLLSCELDHFILRALY